MDKIIEMNKYKNFMFGFKGVLLEKKKRAYGLIVLRNIDTGEVDVHDISEFLIKTYRNNDFSTVRKRAYHLVSFLNFLIHEKRIFSLSSLEIATGTQYLDYLGDVKEVSEQTVKSAERVLVDLYKYLINNDCLTKVGLDSFEQDRKQNNNPFDVTYPPKKHKDIPHNIPHQYIPLIIRIAERVAEPIAFGVFLQIQGGIRNSEVVSLKLGDIQLIGIEGRFGFEVKLKKGNIVRKDTQYYVSTVKKERKQAVYSIDPMSVDNMGMRLFRKHTTKFVATDGTYALFSNPARGKHHSKAMTKKNYARYFNKVRDEFCNQLMNSDNSEEIALGERLAKLEWSTHICRGIFTNKRASEVDNAAQLQHDRGDDNPLSAQAYFEKQKLQQNQHSALSGQIDYLRKLSKKAENNHPAISPIGHFVPMLNVRDQLPTSVIRDNVDSDMEDPFDYFERLLE
ncbi:hypothetical protein ACFCW7_00290 [Paenibacillus glucanolyticus]|uniref:hypothetical protein n=1 Tax=Paenibacillus glucanolyticus TaxID=59843 RepID=UPI0035DA0A7F